MHHIFLGRIGEVCAELHLRSKGYFIWRRRWKCHAGEIDLIALLPRTLIIAEVKTRRAHIEPHFSPLAAIDTEKQTRLSLLAREFLNEETLAIQRMRIEALRFDAVSVIWKSWSLPKIQHIENAFFPVSAEN